MYRTICCELWTDEKVQVLAPLEKLLFLYLITNPHSHLSGIYYIPTVLIEHEVAIGRGFDGAWKGLLASPLVEYDHARSIVWVVKMLRYQGRGQKTEQGVAYHLATLHKSPVITRFLATYPRITPYLPSDFIPCPIEGASMPHVMPHRGFTSPSPSPSPSPSSSSLDLEIAKPEEPRIGSEEIRVCWNAIPGVRPCKKLEGALLERIKKMSREHSPDWWRDLFAEVSKSKFLTGQIPGKEGKRPFRVDLEWVTGPINLGKIQSGKYVDDNMQPTSRGVL